MSYGPQNIVRKWFTTKHLISVWTAGSVVIVLCYLLVLLIRQSNCLNIFVSSNRMCVCVCCGWCLRLLPICETHDLTLLLAISSHLQHHHLHHPGVVSILIFTTTAKILQIIQPHNLQIIISSIVPQDTFKYFFNAASCLTKGSNSSDVLIITSAVRVGCMAWRYRCSTTMILVL